MKRRGFIKKSMVTMAAGAAGPKVLGEIIAPSWSNITSAEMDTFLVELDGAMNRITESTGPYLSNLLKQPSAEKNALMFRAGMRSLLLRGNFGDLSVEGQVHPGVQKRLLYSAPELNSTLVALMDNLKSMPQTARAGIKTALHKNPKLGEQVLETIDSEAQAVGVPGARRLQLRIMGKNILKRLEHSPEMFIEEYIDKYDKLTSLSDSDDDMKKIMTAYMGEKKYADLAQKAESAALRWQKSDLNDIPIGYQPLQLSEDEEKPDGKKKHRGYHVGLKLLGIGAIILATGGLCYLLSGGGGFLFGAAVVLGVTIGPILIVISLLILLITAIVDLVD